MLYRGWNNIIRSCLLSDRSSLFSCVTVFQGSLFGPELNVEVRKLGKDIPFFMAAELFTEMFPGMSNGLTPVGRMLVRFLASAVEICVAINFYLKTDASYCAIGWKCVLHSSLFVDLSHGLCLESIIWSRQRSCCMTVSFLEQLIAQSMQNILKNRLRVFWSPTAVQLDCVVHSPDLFSTISSGEWCNMT